MELTELKVYSGGCDTRNVKRLIEGYSIIKAHIIYLPDSTMLICK